jgi:carbonic anhydrase
MYLPLAPLPQSSILPTPPPSLAPQTRNPPTPPTNLPLPSFPTDSYDTGLAENKNWASKTAKENPSLFPTLASGQHPEILWIGCADSRCPETTILGLQPGDVFVHRNIANIVQTSDLNSSAVIEYAVVYLKVKHIVLCGHTSCGGVAAALANKKLGLIDTWLMPLRKLRQENLEMLQTMSSEEGALKIVELNVLQGVRTLQENHVVLDAIQERGLKLHGLVYNVGSGELRELETGETDEAVKTRLTAFKTSV